VTALCALVGVGAQGGYYAVTTWLPQFLAAERGLAILARGGTLALVIVGAFCGYLFGPGSAIGSAGDGQSCVRGVLVGHRHPYTTAACPVRCSPPCASPSDSSVRPISAASARSSPSNSRPVARLGARLRLQLRAWRRRGVPFLVGVLADALSIGSAIALFAGAAYAVMAVAALLLPETRGKQLAAAAT